MGTRRERGSKRDRGVALGHSDLRFAPVGQLPQDSQKASPTYQETALLP